MPYANIEYDVLTGGDCHARAEGRMVWEQVNATWRSSIAIATSAYSDSEVSVVFKIPVKRPWQPTALLIFRNHPACRLDVNSMHREDGVLYDETHWQWCRRWPSKEAFRTAPDAPAVSRNDAVSGPEYRAVLNYFLDSFAIDRSRLQWADPPGGVQ